MSSDQDYATTPKRLSIRCPNGHTHTKSPDKIRSGQGCPTCSGSRGERIAAVAMEHLFGHPFPKVRPDWLIGLRGRPLELDGFCSTLGVAFEYQGPHHGEVSPWGNAAGDVRSRDARKALLCAQRGISLVPIPMFPDHKFTSNADLMEHVRAAITAAGITPPTATTLPDLVLITQNRTDLEDMRAWGRRCGLVCLSTVFRTPRTLERWLCTVCNKEVLSSWGHLRKSRMGRESPTAGCGACLQHSTRRQRDPSYGRLTARTQQAIDALSARGQRIRSVAELCLHIETDGLGKVMLPSVWKILQTQTEINARAASIGVPPRSRRKV